VMKNRSEIDWFNELPTTLKKHLHDGWGGQLQIHCEQLEPEEQFYDCDSELHNETETFHNPPEVGQEFQILTLVYPLMDDNIKDMVTTTIGRNSVGMTKHVMEQGQLITLTSRNKVLLRYWVVSKGLELKLITLDCVPRIVKNMEILVNRWNDVVLEQIGNSNLWYTLTQDHKRHIVENFRRVIQIDSMQYMSPTMLNEKFRDLLASGQVEDLQSMDAEQVEQTLINIVAHPSQYPEAAELTNMHNADNSLCLCEDQQSWWNTGKVDPEYKFETLNPSSKTTTLIRLLAETTQLYETCGAAYAVEICGQQIGIETFGGCSLCCGLAFVTWDRIFKNRPTYNCGINTCSADKTK